jgi:hypothetical protein
MEVLKKIEEVLNVKIIENVEKVRGKSFPLFDTVNLHGIKLALIKNPLFVVIGDDDVYEKRIEGNFIVVETDDGYILARYTGEPNIEALRNADTEEEKVEHGNEEEVGIENGKDEEQESGGKGGQDEEQDGDDPVKEILEKLPNWADGAVVVKKSGNVIVLPIKKSAKKDDAYYASVSWKPLTSSGAEDLVNHVITKDGKTLKANVYVGDKYINIFVGARSSNRPRRYYSGRRR